MLSLQDKVAIVTGAASGLGKQIALLFAKQGAKVVAADYHKESLDAFIAEVEPGLIISPVVADISRLEEVTRIYQHAQDTFQQLDIVVNNAGVTDLLDPIGSATDEIFDKVMNINLRGTFYMMREAVNIFEPIGRGIIVNIASVAGVEGGRAGAVYTASKHGIIGLTKNTAHFYGHHGIRCNAVAPGGMKTNIMQGNINLSTAGKLVKALLAARNQRIADPLEVANIALFLASDESSFMNGAVVVADGGWSAF